MKKVYIAPYMKLFALKPARLMAGSGPNADDQNNPVVGGGGARIFADEFDDFEDEFENE